MVDGIVEKMLSNFTNPEIFVSPLLRRFEIQKDDCYERIISKFGERFLDFETDSGKEIIMFNFFEAVKSVLPSSATFDERDTFQNNNLASFRRDRDNKRNYTGS